MLYGALANLFGEFKSTANCFQNSTSFRARKDLYFSAFWTLLLPMMMHFLPPRPPPEGGGELLGGDSSRNPFPCRFQAVLIPADARQLMQVCGCQV
jgi:hypothetical protein